MSFNTILYPHNITPTCVDIKINPIMYSDKIIDQWNRLVKNYLDYTNINIATLYTTFQKGTIPRRYYDIVRKPLNNNDPFEGSILKCISFQPYICGCPIIFADTQHIFTNIDLFLNKLFEVSIVCISVNLNILFKSCKWFPDKLNKTKVFNDYELVCKNISITKSYYTKEEIKRYDIEIKYNNTINNIIILQYTNWINGGVPQDNNLFVNYITYINSIIDLQLKNNTYKGLLSHCCAGAGRSAVVVLCLEILRTYNKNNKYIDIFSLVTKCRKYRTIIIHTLEQYKYLFSFAYEIAD